MATTDEHARWAAEYRGRSRDLKWLAIDLGAIAVSTAKGMSEPKHLLVGITGVGASQVVGPTMSRVSSRHDGYLRDAMGQKGLRGPPARTQNTLDDSATCVTRRTRNNQQTNIYAFVPRHARSFHIGLSPSNGQRESVHTFPEKLG